MTRPLTDDQVVARRDELVAKLRATGADVREHGKDEPTRDHFAIRVRWTAGRTDVEMAAYHRPTWMHVGVDTRRAGALWCYVPPVGVPVVDEAPEGWEGWTATGEAVERYRAAMAAMGLTGADGMPIDPGGR